MNQKADLSAPLVIIPDSIPGSQEALKNLCDADIDSLVRNSGTGSASARVVVVSTSKFYSFSFDAESASSTLALCLTGARSIGNWRSMLLDLQLLVLDVHG